MCGSMHLRTEHVSQHVGSLNMYFSMLKGIKHVSQHGMEYKNMGHNM